MKLPGPARALVAARAMISLLVIAACSSSGTLTSTPTPTPGPTPPQNLLDADDPAVSCVIEGGLSMEVLGRLAAGERPPTQEELTVLESCIITPSREPGDDSLDPVVTCLIVGGLSMEAFNRLNTEDPQLTPEELAIFESCGVSSGRDVVDDALLNMCSTQRSSMEESTGAVTGLATNIGFQEVAAIAGVDFHHTRDDFLFNFGGGAAIGDYNSDGLLDIYVTNSAGANALYRNDGDGTFTDVAGVAGVDDSMGRGYGAGWGDYDNDGDLDLFVANLGTSKLFRNNGEGAFTDVTAEARVGDPDAEHTTMGITWGDYDQDGYIDLLVVRHLYQPEFEPIESRDFSVAVRPLALYHNDGDGTFTNVTSLLGDSSIYPSNVKGAGFKPAFLDYDNDGDPDIYVVNDFGKENYPNVLWRNDGPDVAGAWIFTDVSASSGADLRMFGMGLAVGDYDNDGDLDFYISDCGDSEFLENQGDGTFNNITERTGTGRGRILEVEDIEVSFGWGTVFVDLDNDGLLDLYYVAGLMDSDSEIEHQPNAVFANNGDGTFSDISALSRGDDPGIGREVAAADFNNDGLIDLFVVNLGKLDGTPGIARLFINTSDNINHWLGIRTIGTTSNRDGMGTRITVTAAGVTQIREMGVSQGHTSHSVVPVHFGLGTATQADVVEIRWPSGTVQVLPGVPADQLLIVTEP